ncbi:MAG: RICIN domain-containing protein, partial [Blautia sp.]|nr:RICIN domain-containing protein [Blautia sp.]
TMSPRVRDMVGWYSGTPFLFFWRQYTEQFTDNQVDHLEDNLTYLKQYVILSDVDNSYEIDLPGNTGDLENGADIQLWKSDETMSQYNAFDVRKLENGYYILTHVASGKEISQGGTSASGAIIGLYEANSHPAHMWAITKDVDNGGYILRSKASGMAMGLEDGAAGNGTKVRQFSYNGTKAQTWKFVKAEYNVEYDANGGSRAPAAQTKYYKENLVLSEIFPVRNGYEFIGWSKKASAASADYQPGDLYKQEIDLTLYAIWSELKPDFILPASLTAIEEEAFAGGVFRYAQLPENARAIRTKAFADCERLKHIYIPEATNTIAADAFDGVKDLTIHGIDGSYAEYYAGEHGYAFMKE